MFEWLERPPAGRTGFESENEIMLHGFSLDRKLMALAEQRATVETAAQSLGKSAEAIRKQARVLGSVRLVELRLKVKR